MGEESKETVVRNLSKNRVKVLINIKHYEFNAYMNFQAINLKNKNYTYNFQRERRNLKY